MSLVRTRRSSSVTSASSSSALSNSNHQPILLFRSLKDRLRFNHQVDQIIEDEKDSRRTLSKIETKTFNALIDAVVRSNIIESRKHDDRVRLCAREAHFRLSIHEERTAWYSVIEDLLNQYERRIIMNSRETTGQWQSIRVPHHQQQQRQKGNFSTNNNNQFGDSDSERHPSQLLSPMTARPHEEENTENDVDDETSATKRTRRSQGKGGVGSPIVFVMNDDEEKQNEKTTTSPQKYDLPTFQRRTSVMIVTNEEEEDLDARKKQSSPKKNATKATKSKPLTASGLFGSSTDTTEMKRQLRQNLTKSQKGGAASTMMSASALSRGRPNPFEAIISKNNNNNNTHESSPKSVTTSRIDDVLLKHGARNEFGNSVVVRTADKRKIEQMHLARSKKEAVWAKSLNPTANDMNGLF